MKLLLAITVSTVVYYLYREYDYVSPHEEGRWE